MISRGGKATGKNRVYLNIRDEVENEAIFDKEVEEWKPFDQELETEIPNLAIAHTQSDHKSQVESAKSVELQNWKSFNV